MRLKSRALAQGGHLRSRLKTLAVIGTAAAGLAGLATAQAGPAAADPTEGYIAVGSTVTQDVMNQYSVDLTGNLLGSYNAVDPVTGASGNISFIKGASALAPALSCSPFTRPDGSDQGLTALRESINPGTAASPPLSAVALQGCVDIDRSATGPASDAAGALAYIPFAEDAVAGAVGGGPLTPPTDITEANLFTKQDLINLYANCTSVTEGGVTYSPDGAAGQQRIDLYVPQPGSEIRSFWAQQLGFNGVTLPACVHDTIVFGPDSGHEVLDNDGTAVQSDIFGFMPFSISAWIAQRNGFASDHLHLAALTSIDGISPFSNGNAASGFLNAAFPIRHEVYNVVEACRVDSTAPLPFTGATCGVDQNLVSMLAGAGASLCEDPLTMLNYGFALLSSANEPDRCGSIAPTLRSQAPPV